MAVFEQYHEIASAERDPTQLETGHTQRGRSATRYVMQQDVYSYAFLCFLGLEEQDLDNGGFSCSKAFRQSWGLPMMIACAILQFAAIQSVYESCASRNEEMDLAKGFFQKSQFMGHKGGLKGSPVSYEDVELFCGKFEKEIKSVPRNSIMWKSLKKRGHIQSDNQTIVWWMAQLWPSRFQEQQWQPNMIHVESASYLFRSIYQLTIFTPELGNSHFIVFVVAFVAWTCLMIWEISDVWSFFYSIWSLDRIEGKRYDDAAESTLKIKGLSSGCCGIWEKTIAAFIAAIRFTLAIFLFFVGNLFLRSTVGVVSLLLNAIGLGFLVELDAGFYKAFKAFRGDIGLIDRDIHIVVVETSTEQKHIYRKAFAPVILFLALFGSVYGNWRLEFEHLQNEFTLFSSICLFLGPHPKGITSTVTSYPVPLFCESLVCGGNYFAKNPVAHWGCRGSAYKDIRFDWNDPERFGLYVNSLRDVCLGMFQVNSSDNPPYVARGVGEQEQLSAPFWCPTRVVAHKAGLESMHIMRGDNAKPFWKSKDWASCQDWSLGGARRGPHELNMGNPKTGKSKD